METGFVGSPVDGMLALVEMCVLAVLGGTHGVLMERVIRMMMLVKDGRLRLLLWGAAVFAALIILTCFGVFSFVIASGEADELMRFAAWCCFGFLTGFMVVEAWRADR